MFISSLADFCKDGYAFSMTGNARPDRRNFLKSASLTALAATGGTLATSVVAADKVPTLPHEFCTFTKAIQHMSYDEVSKVIADIGFDGVESAVRPGGHVEPERVTEDLPKMVESLKKQDLKLTVMTSAINEVSKEQHTESVLKTAADLGVERFRMGYYKYDLKKPIKPQLDEFRPKLKDLVAMCTELGIKPVYQNHSGKNYLGGPIWDLAGLLEEFDPDHVGCAFDVGHATVEGAKAWPLNFARIRSHIDTVYLKEPNWLDGKIQFGALGTGMVDKGFYKALKTSNFTGPISVHVEYLGHKDPKIMPAVIKAMAENFATAKQFLSEA